MVPQQTGISRVCVPINNFPAPLWGRWCWELYILNFPYIWVNWARVIFLTLGWGSECLPVCVPVCFPIGVFQLALWVRSLDWMGGWRGAGDLSLYPSSTYFSLSNAFPLKWPVLAPLFSISLLLMIHPFPFSPSYIYGPIVQPWWFLFHSAANQ